MNPLTKEERAAWSALARRSLAHANREDFIEGAMLRAIETIDALTAMLRDLAGHSSVQYDSIGGCAKCRQANHEGHTPDCPLASLLAEVDGDPEETA